MLSWPPETDDWHTFLSGGNIVVVLTPVEGPIAAARGVSRQLCSLLQERFPGHRTSRSATAGMAAVALAQATPIGVDVERVDPQFQLDAGLLAAALDPQELATLRRPAVGRFLQLWTCKESALKAAGVGLALPPATVHVGWVTEDWTGVDFGARASPAQVRSLAAPRGFAAAIATLGAPCEVQLLTRFVPRGGAHDSRDDRDAGLKSRSFETRPPRRCGAAGRSCDSADRASSAAS